MCWYCCCCCCCWLGVLDRSGMVRRQSLQPMSSPSCAGKRERRWWLRFSAGISVRRARRRCVERDLAWGTRPETGARSTGRWCFVSNERAGQQPATMGPWMKKTASGTTRKGDEGEEGMGDGSRGGWSKGSRTEIATRGRPEQGGEAVDLYHVQAVMTAKEETTRSPGGWPAWHSQEWVERVQVGRGVCR